MPVSLRARASQWDGATPLDYEGVLTVRRTGDERLLLAIVTGQSPPADLEVIAAQREAVCRSRPEPLCRRVLTAYSLQFGTSSGARGERERGGGDGEDGGAGGHALGYGCLTISKDTTGRVRSAHSTPPLGVRA